jgi:hypothetical protein
VEAGKSHIGQPHGCAGLPGKPVPVAGLHQHEHAGSEGAPRGAEVVPPLSFFNPEDFVEIVIVQFGRRDRREFRTAEMETMGRAHKVSEAEVSDAPFHAARA